MNQECKIRDWNNIGRTCIVCQPNTKMELCRGLYLTYYKCFNCGYVIYEGEF